MQRQKSERDLSLRRTGSEREVAALKRFKKLMKKNEGKLNFAGHRD